MSILKKKCQNFNYNITENSIFWNFLEFEFLEFIIHNDSTKTPHAFSQIS